MELHPSLAEFSRQARRATVVPVWAELLADVETPVSAFLKLDDGRHSFLLESVEGEEKVARFSFLGSCPRLLVASRGRDMEIVQRTSARRSVLKRFRTDRDPLAEIEQLLRGYAGLPVPGLPRFYGGLVGYLGYNVVRFLERVPAHQVDRLQVPDMMMMLADTMVIVDHAQHTLRLVANAFAREAAPEALYRRCGARIREMARRLAQPMPRRGSRKARRRLHDPAVRSNLTKAQFTRMVRQAKASIRAGEIIQTVLSQRFERRLSCEPFELYRALRSLNPSPYMYFLRFGSMCLVGSSPEMLVRCEQGSIETRPIAGTRARGRNPREDERLARQLMASPKERAEHLMLVDLGRNDLGRVAQIGTVTTPQVMVVEKYSHVMHLVSSVRAKLRQGRNAFDVLRATFPAGTVTGAPKVRAMERIAQLERDDRGPYAGAVGYIGFSGNLDTCITIRTILVKDGVAYVQAGAGIVADSQPEREYQETINKAKGMLRAIQMAEHRRMAP